MTLPEQMPFASRRARLMEKMGNDAIAIIATRAEMYRNRDADYKFRADSSFYYLTGFAEPEAVAVLDSGCTQPYTLFCRERNREMEIWNGLRAGTEGAVNQYAADQAFIIQQLDEQIIGLLSGKKRLYVRLGQDAEFDLRVTGWLKKIAANQRQGGQGPVEIIQLDSILDEMRLFKDPHEINLMRKAAQISAQAHMRAMQQAKPGMMEYALEAELLYVFAQNGCQTAYNSIVGGGANGCILHYVENNQPLKDGDLVLIDAGAELDHYAADITRTFPVNGQFSPEQKALYELVLKAQLAAIEATKPGNHYRLPHETAVRILTEGLVELGLLQGNVDELISSEAYRQFYMHGTGHWLGMDVHDVGSYKLNNEWRPYQPGMVVTVEPGLYIAPDDETVEARWRGIGIRIEDDVLLTTTGNEVLTKDVPKTVEEIEALMQKAG
ncbi:Xaa-Pro aminopeptidase [Alkanindiges hydrocarboniclasticus]|uniref:Xaa-Pro aminopeptidase n=1 Tax=Alkanindiges hydrocarboniclasticus TaxID=1907941 RepID=A0A1S8CSP2_9GAMM|nr:Xaa-Pro aminopeptidase [Alkanindiges hydrocarboniclasticus]ONG39143.1 Xaa-Pro aminopeptidase [Alkanindiges hydrocarboniclasticus]